MVYLIKFYFYIHGSKENKQNPFHHYTCFEQFNNSFYQTHKCYFKDWWSF